MKTYLTIVLIYFFTLNINAQIPIGKDIKIGKTEIINLLKKNGYTYLKETKDQVKRYNELTGKYDIFVNNFYKVYFKEEISLNIFYNEYENITDVYVILGDMYDGKSHLNREKILKIFKSNEWEFIKEKKSFYFQPNKYYIYKSFYIMDSPNDMMQINFYKKMPEDLIN